MNKGQAGQMRLNREARMAKKDLDAQVKKNGKISDNFICLPDPDDVYSWYYVIFGLAEDEFKGGYYFGKVTCPQEYPAKAPNIKLFTENGKLSTQSDGICLSISDFHQESWNPAWKVNQIVIGLLSFWLSDEDTYGSVYEHDYDHDDDWTFSQRKTQFAIDSRKSVLEHEMFQKVFANYADAIGINKAPENNEFGWDEFIAEREVINKKKEEKAAIKAEEDRINAERLAKEEADRKLKEELKKAEEDKLAQKKNIDDYFKAIQKMGLNKYIGQPEQIKKVLAQKRQVAA